MGYVVPESKASIRQNQVEVELGGKKYYVPKVQFLPASISATLRKLRHGMQQFISDRDAGVVREPTEDELLLIGEVEDLQRQILEQYIPGLWSKCDAEQIRGIVEYWNSESGISVGE